MPIKFRCPNPACDKPITVSDQGAGRAGKCPACGSALVVPRPQPVVVEQFDDLKFLPPAPETAQDPDWDPIPGKGQTGPVISFDVFGLAWGLLSRQLGTWILAVFVLFLAQVGCQIVLSVLSGLAAVVESTVISSPVPISSLALMLVGIMIQGVLVGGLYKMALKQIDGGEIGVGDLFAISKVAPGLAIASLITGLGTYFGLMFLIVPGMVFAGLVMFTAPSVIEGLPPIDAIKRSFATLKEQWLLASVFVVLNVMLMVSGVLFCGFGLFLTVPLGVLAMSLQYRRSFAPAGLPRKLVVADPWAEAIGEPSRATGSGRMPIWAWGIFGLGVIVPTALLFVIFALVYPAVRKAAQQSAVQQQRNFPGGFGAPVGQPVLPPELDPSSPLSDPSMDPVDRMLSTSVRRPDNRPFDLAGLAIHPVNDRQRAKVVAAVAPLLMDPVSGREAAMVMEQWAGPADVPTLIAGLGSKEYSVRMFLYHALRRLKAEAAVPILVANLARAEDRDEATRTLQAIGPQAVPEIQKQLTSDDKATRRAAATLLRELAGNDRLKQVAAALATLNCPDGWERDRALEVIARPPVVDDSRSEVLAAVVRLLKSKNIEASNALNSLKVIELWGSDDQIPAIIDALEIRDRNVQFRALGLLRKHPSPESALAIARLLTSDTVRREAVDALVAMKVHDDNVEAEVLKALDQPDSASQEAACKVLRVIGSSASVPALKKAAGSDVRVVSRAALAALRAIDPTAVPGTPAEKTPKKMTPRKK